jgi:hypothetical protein
LLLQNNNLRAISGAFRAILIKNIEVNVGVHKLGVQLYSIDAQFKVSQEEW